MNGFSKKAFRYGKYIIALGSMAFLIFISTKMVLAGTDYPYLIKVNRVQNTITVYEKDQAGEYTVPVKAIVCSVGQNGTETILGTFQTKGKYRWKALMGDVWGQYSTRIVGGILFHSVYYYENENPASLAVKEYNKLGKPASHGCIRMTVGDAKWIYDHCPIGTTVIIYDDKKNPGPLGKPEAMKITSSLRWDPTDPTKGNPYWNKKPTITGAKNRTVELGEEIDLLEGITAKSSGRTDITEDIRIEGIVDWYKAGKYKITYSVTDAMGKACSKTTTITVEDSMEPPKFVGVRDRIVANEDQITPENVMKGVRAFQGGKLLEQEKIEVDIEQILEDEYEVTYQVYAGKVILTSITTRFIIDDLAPVISNISDRVLEPGQVPDREYALVGVSITDNYTKMKLEDIQVTIEETQSNTGDSSEAADAAGIPNYLVTYEATDEVGNIVRNTVHFHY